MHARQRIGEGLRLILAPVLALLVGVYIVLNEIGARREARDQIEQHASVISTSVWTVDRDGVRDYLQLAIDNGRYETLAVRTDDSEPFYSGSGTPLESLADRFLGWVGLIPVLHLRADVTRGGVLIGTIEASARLGTIYADLYALVLGLLLFLAARLYLDLLDANRDLDVKVRERTKQLTESSQEMHKLYLRLGTVEEDERRGLHRELHDRIGGNLSALRRQLDLAKSLLERQDPEAALGHVGGAMELTRETVLQTRDLMVELRPPGLDDLGVVGALRTLAAAQSQRFGLPIEVFGADPAPRPSALVESTLFRIAHEALVNAGQHADARRVTVSFTQPDGRLHMAIEDDGTGFDPRSAAAAGHWGLRSMQERARTIGAELRIESAAGNGTRVVVEIPAAA